MDIHMYKNSAEKIVLNKDSYLLSEIHLSGYLRDECDIINPVIEISKAAYSKIWYGTETVDVQSAGQDVISNNPYKVPEHNYIYIPQFKRYYFIDNITSVRKGLWRISMSVDVLMSFRDDINNLTGIVKRSTISTRTNLKDDAAIIPAKYNIEKINSIFQSPIMDTNIDLAGTGSNSFYIYAITTVSTYENWYPELFADEFWYEYPDEIVVRRANSWQSNLHISNSKWIMQVTNSSSTLLDTSLDYFINAVKDNSDQINSVISVMLYPFNFQNKQFFSDARSDGTDSEFIQYNPPNFTRYPKGIRLNPSNPKYIGYTRFQIGSGSDAFYGAPISNSFNNKILIGRFNFTTYSDDWDKFSPYSKYFIYIPFLGYKELDYNKIVGKYVEVYFVMNWDDGSANVMVIATPDLGSSINVCSNGIQVVVNGKKVIYSSSQGRNEILLLEDNVQVGISVPLSASNEAENSRKREAYTLQSVGTMIASALTAIMAAAAIPATGGGSLGAYLAVMGGIGGIIGSGVSYAAQEGQLIDVTRSMGNLGNVSASCSPNESHIIRLYSNISYPENYENIIGKIDLTTRTISEIPNGYVQFANVHVDGLSNATLSEVNKVEQTLLQGILIN